MLWDSSNADYVPHEIERMCWLDTQTYFPDDFLVKVDRASMAYSLEARVPLVDHRVVEWFWRLPLNMKVRKNESKWILRQILGKHIPASFFERPEMGFGIPIGEFLRGPLREWASDLLSESTLRQQNLLHPKPLQDMWQNHLTGRVNAQYVLWNVLMLDAWVLQTKA